MSVEILNNTEVYKEYSEISHSSPSKQSHSPKVITVNVSMGIYPDIFLYTLKCTCIHTHTEINLNFKKWLGTVKCVL